MDFNLGLVDSDGVQIMTEDALNDAHARILAERYGKRFDIASKRVTAGRPGEESARALLVYHGVEPDQDEVALVRRLRGEYLAEWYSDPKWLPGFRKYQQSLRDVFPLAQWAVVTSSSRDQYDRVMRALPIREMFGGVFLSEECVQRGKPDPAIFRYAAHVMGENPLVCATWEDSPAGLAASIRAGIPKNIAVTRTLPQAQLTEGVEAILERTLKPDEILFLGDRYDLPALRETVRYLQIPIPHAPWGISP